ncbi:Crp/Fnr family transcriptional regulator [Virgibacillus doumboii]|uniref:Crp/Fnr family transcriptional regulator n=1 Tax=Virgibacillus doumboii TaxID=2697503 RepID=UPI0013DF6D36|nr:Crp/Fnr family transcriptional regulator [Virgibacillus doumboii]
MEPLLQRFNEQECELLMARSTQMDFKKGSFVFEEGYPANHLYVIHTGEIRIFKNLGKNKDLTIFTRGDNDGFGEIGVFSGNNYSNSAQALRDSVIYSIEQSELDAVLSQNGGLSLHFTRWVAESLEASKAKMRDYLAFGSEGAVASVFVRYSNMYGVVTPAGVKITEPIMIQDISKEIAISRETVSRIVNKWKEKGLIDNSAKYYLLKDMNYFRDLLACEHCGVENCVI